jgi:hypothetical protein
VSKFADSWARDAATAPVTWSNSFQSSSYPKFRKKISTSLQLILLLRNKRGVSIYFDWGNRSPHPIHVHTRSHTEKPPFFKEIKIMKKRNKIGKGRNDYYAAAVVWSVAAAASLLITISIQSGPSFLRSSHWPDESDYRPHSVADIPFNYRKIFIYFFNFFFKLHFFFTFFS